MNLLYMFPLFVCGVAAIPVTYDQRQDGEVNVRADLQNFIIVALVPKIGPPVGGSALLDAISSSLNKRKELKNFNGKNSEDIELEREVDEVDIADARVADAFVKQKPYQVDITRSKSNAPKTKPQSRSANAKRRGSHSAEDSPVPDILPVKNNQYVAAKGRNGRVLEVINLNFDVTESYGPSVVDDNETKDENFDEKLDAIKRKDSGLLLIGATEQCGPYRYRDEKGVCRSA